MTLLIDIISHPVNALEGMVFVHNSGKFVENYYSNSIVHLEISRLKICQTEDTVENLLSIRSSHTHRYLDNYLIQHRQFTRLFGKYLNTRGHF